METSGSLPSHRRSLNWRGRLPRLFRRAFANPAKATGNFSEQPRQWIQHCAREKRVDPNTSP
eukprot:6466269-Heterocapsa_arctica.AAC.1